MIIIKAHLTLGYLLQSCKFLNFSTFSPADFDQVLRGHPLKSRADQILAGGRLSLPGVMFSQNVGM